MVISICFLRRNTNSVINETKEKAPYRGARRFPTLYVLYHSVDIAQVL